MLCAITPKRSSVAPKIRLENRSSSKIIFTVLPLYCCALIGLVHEYWSFVASGKVPVDTRNHDCTCSAKVLAVSFTGRLLRFCPELISAVSHSLKALKFNFQRAFAWLLLSPPPACYDVKELGATGRTWTCTPRIICPVLWRNIKPSLYQLSYSGNCLLLFYFSSLSAGCRLFSRQL